MNEPNEAEIPWHLVGDALRHWCRGDDGIEIACAELAQLFGRKSWNSLGIGQSAIRHTEASHRLAEFCKFPSAEDLRVTCQYLLDQGRARARHANNKYRNHRGIAKIPLAVHQFSREYGANAIQKAQHPWFVINELASLEGVTFEEVTEGPLALLHVRIGFAQCEM